MPDQRAAPAEPEVSGVERLKSSFLRPSRSQAIAGVLLALVGFAAVTQMRAKDVDNTYAGYREQDLIDVLNGLSGASQRADAELARLERTRDELSSSNNRRQTALTEAEKSLADYNILAGLVPVTGPGLRITITESAGRVELETMVDLIQELRNAGAEAIGVNDKVRLVAQSAVEGTVGGFAFDGQAVRSPYVIDVIGDPATLRAGITILRGPVDQMRESGATVELQEFTSLDIAEVRQPVKPQYAEPDDS